MSSEVLIRQVRQYAAANSVFMIALAVVSLIGMWKVFTKAGEAGWKCLIPIYDLHVFARICWKASWFWYSFLATVVLGVVGLTVGDWLGVFLLAAAGCIELAYTILSMHHLAKRFGKGTGFTVLLILINFIGLMILGFGSADYRLDRD